MTPPSAFPIARVLRTVLMLLVGCVGTLTAQEPPYQLGPATIQYLNALKIWSVPGSSSGSFSGTVASVNATSNSGDLAHFDYVFTVCVPNPFGGCLWTHDYGQKIDFDFAVEGPLKYTYRVPFSVTFDFPSQVYAGQKIYLVPIFSWGDAQVRGSQDVSYSETTSAWLDAPFDGLDELSIVFTQRATSADLHLRFPVLPLLPSVPVDLENIRVWPFNEGGGEFGGSYTKLGGTGSLAAGGTYVYSFDGSYVMAGGENDCPRSCASIPAWKQGHEVFKLVATVLQMIPNPATIAAGLALDFVRQAGDFRLDALLQGSVDREDVVDIQIADLPYVIVPPVHDVWEFSDFPVSVRYRVRTYHSFWYPLGARVTFDMLGIDPVELASWDATPLLAGTAWSDWQETTGSFLISGRVDVKPRPMFPQQVQLDSGATLPGTAQPARIATRPALAQVQGPQRTFHKQVTIPFPRPTARQGLPRAGHNTVILGTAPAARAARIVSILKSKGIAAFPVAVAQSSNQAITLGSFAREPDARLLSNMLKEIFQIESAVAPRVERRYFRALGDDLITKLAAH